MKKNWFKLILVTMVVVFYFTALPVLAMEKRDAKVTNNSKTKTTISPSENDQNVLCKKVVSLIKTRDISKYLSPMENIPDTSIYRTLDIDGDGITDKVEVSSGSEESYLKVKLSNDGGYDLSENGSIMIVNIDAKVCALVTYWERKKRPDGSLESKEVSHRLYLLTKQNAKMICDKF